MQTETVNVIRNYFDTNIQAEKDTEARLLSDLRHDEAIFPVSGEMFTAFSLLFSMPP